MVNGAATDAVPVTPARLLWTVKVRSAKLPMLTLPKATVVVGVTVKSGFAVALATAEHVLALPAESTATTETLWTVLLIRPMSRALTVSPAGGVGLEEGTVTKVPLGHGVAEVP